MKFPRKDSLLTQIYIIVMLCLIVASAISYRTQENLARLNETEDLQSFAELVSGETISAVKDFPSYEWLLNYWYTHSDEMKIGYDSDPEGAALNREKAAVLAERHPKLPVRYATTEEIEALPEEDQRLFAEIAYAALLSRVDQIKHSYGIDFLYCVIVDTDEGAHPYASQFFLFSGANPGDVRGNAYTEVYPIGHITDTTEKPELQGAMRNAVLQGQSGLEVKALDQSGNYIDDYSYLSMIGNNKAALIGVSYSISEALLDIRNTTLHGTLSSAIQQFLLLHLVLLHLFFVIVRPVQKIADNIRHYSEAKNSAPVKRSLSEMLESPTGLILKRNEIGQLSEDIVQMVDEIDDHINEIAQITSQNERIEAELKLGANIQMAMLPPSRPELPEDAPYDLYATMSPAREVGGDFYDYFMIDPEHICLVMADVSGKGVPAALFMAITKTLIKDRTQKGEKARKILKHVNNRLCDGNSLGYFVTVWLAIIDLTTGEGTAVNAGHEHPVLYRKGSSFELVRYKHDPVIGMIENLEFTEHHFELHKGDRLFVYTDGVPEAADPAYNMFGTEGMLASLNRDPEVPLKDLLQTLREDISRFADGAEQFDDITMLGFEYKG